MAIVPRTQPTNPNNKIGKVAVSAVRNNQPRGVKGSFSGFPETTTLKADDGYTIHNAITELDTTENPYAYSF